MYALQTRMKALAIAGMMAASVAGGAVTAFATPTNTLSGDGVLVKKTIQVAEGITLPEKKMKFAATFVTSTVQGVTSETAPTIKPLELTFSKGASGDALTQTGAIAETKEFEKAVPGEYVYTLKEETTSDTTEYGWKCDQTEYVLRVYVDSKNDVKYTVVESDRDDEKNVALDNDSKDSKKLDKASFSNIYTKKGGSESVGPSLVVNKTVDGTYGDQKQYFKFTVTFDTPDTEDAIHAARKFKMTFTQNEGGTYSGADEASKGYSANTEELDLTDNDSYVFYLKSGGSVSFDNIPAGTKYTLAEAGADRYTATFVVTEDGAATPKSQTGSENEGLSMSELLIGEKRNEVAVTNRAKDITITGVVTHSAPFVIMVGALFVAVGGYVVLKKKIEE